MRHYGYEKVSCSLLLATLCLPGCSGSDGGANSAQVVETPGNGRYERIKARVFISVSDGSIQATIPTSVSVGQTIDVSFESDGQKITDTWKVVRISTKDALCRLHSAPDRNIGNTVYVKPCTVVR